MSSASNPPSNQTSKAASGAGSGAGSASAPDRQVVLSGKSYQDYVAAVEEYPALRVELLNGEIIMTPARSPYHQLVSVNLLILLGHYAKQHGLGVVMAAPLDVVLAREAQIIQPDLIYISKERAPKLLGKAAITGAPDLALEILSPSTTRTDRKIKLPLYARYGVPEYWLVDPDDPSVEIFLLDGESYRVGGIFLSGDTISVGAFAPAQITVDSIFSA
ncbi:MAG TPA: Uma2 family endonuclease [Caldilineaceae bacterium]|nr:Uma2 family endonuclease [Caldilineaceae bacterium]